MTDQDFERRLRTALAAHVQDAPRSDVVERRVLDAALVVPPRRRLQWRTFTAPVVAAGAVAALVIALVGLRHDHPSASHTVPPATQGSSDSAPASPSATATSSPTSSPSPTHTSVLTAGSPITVPGLTHVQIRDLSFVGRSIWALAWADCSSSAGSCSTLVHSVDDGTSWRAVAPPQSENKATTCEVGPCLSHIRFATDNAGYVFGRNTMSMTTNGGRSWVQTLGAVALETLDGNVIRVLPTPIGCSPPGCTYTAQTAAIGSTVWHDTGLRATAHGMSTGAALVREGSHAALVVFGHPSGGASDARSNVYVSFNDGATWGERGEPCQQGPVETDTTAITAPGADGVFVILCTRRDASGEQFVEASKGEGGGFYPGALMAGMRSLLAAPTRDDIVVGSPGLSRSADGGRTWTQILRSGALVWLGFESTTAGAAVSGDGATIYRTTDGGATWTSHTFT